MVGELAEDCSFVSLDHHKPLRRILHNLVGQKLEVTISKLKYKRSDGQNRWLWGVAYVQVTNFIKEMTGERVDKETIHEYSKQHIIGTRAKDSIVMEKEEFRTMISEVITLSEAGKPGDDILAIVDKNMKYWEASVRIKEIMGTRTVVSPEVKTTSKMNTVEFGEFKDALQAHYGDRGLEIADPRENNMLSDYLKDE